jgi:hypothetical protein
LWGRSFHLDLLGGSWGVHSDSHVSVARSKRPPQNNITRKFFKTAFRRERSCFQGNYKTIMKQLGSVLVRFRETSALELGIFSR